MKQPPKVFCRNEHNVSGVCSKVTCPLANSNYATIVEKEGICYLYIKTVERAHLPRDLWEKIKLDANFGESLRQIEENLEYWPVHMVNRCKQRLTRIRQTLSRMRKLALRDNQVTLVPIKTKTVKRETAREAKAERAAQVEKTVQNELLERLRQGKFGIYNYPFNQFNSAVEELNPDEVEQEYEYEDEESVMSRPTLKTSWLERMTTTDLKLMKTISALRNSMTTLIMECWNGDQRMRDWFLTMKIPRRKPRS
jgi:protein MAK16